jgi:hypothetical protein
MRRSSHQQPANRQKSPAHPPAHLTKPNRAKAQLPLAIATNVGFGEFNEYVLIANPEPPRR